MSDATTLPLRPLWRDDLRAAAASAPRRWLWHGYLAAGATTLLTAPWKAGKTTLLAALLRHLCTGGSLAGEPVVAGRALIATEEDATLWQQRADRFGIGGHVGWICRPFRTAPTPAQWLGFLDELAAVGRDHAVDLVAIDPLRSFLPSRGENHAGLMLEALVPLSRLTSQGCTVLMLHHSRKCAAAPGQQARGSGALSGHVDVLLELTGVDGPDNRRRRLRGFSRFAETPADRVLELNADGTDYASLGDGAEEEFVSSWQVLHGVLTDARGPRTRAELLAGWPADHPRPSDATLWRWLERGVALGDVQRRGAGRRHDPFRYWLAGQEEVWARDPHGVLNDLQEMLLGPQGGNTTGEPGA
jgi:hypothetical protein